MSNNDPVTLALEKLQERQAQWKIQPFSGFPLTVERTDVTLTLQEVQVCPTAFRIRYRLTGPFSSSSVPFGPRPLLAGISLVVNGEQGYHLQPSSGGSIQTTQNAALLEGFFEWSPALPSKVQHLVFQVDQLLLNCPQSLTTTEKLILVEGPWLFDIVRG